MPIVGEFPESGLRVELERPWEPVSAPWVYRGHAVTASARWPMTAVVTEAGEVLVQLADAAGAPGGLTERARLLIRAAWKHATREAGPEAPPPRRIIRWRSDREKN